MPPPRCKRCGHVWHQHTIKDGKKICLHITNGVYDCDCEDEDDEDDEEDN